MRLIMHVHYLSFCSCMRTPHTCKTLKNHLPQNADQNMKTTAEGLPECTRMHFQSAMLKTHLGRRGHIKPKTRNQKASKQEHMCNHNVSERSSKTRKQTKTARAYSQAFFSSRVRGQPMKRRSWRSRGMLLESVNPTRFAVACARARCA